MSHTLQRPLDETAFEKLRRIVPGMRKSRGAAQGFAGEAPEEIAFKLTNRCDLRCSHCYQWSGTGYHHNLPSAERNSDMDLALIATVLESTRHCKSNVYLWGGEPLVYRQWDGLVDLLADDPRWTSLCTNGTLLEKRLDSLLPLSAQLEISVSMDGFEEAHDRVRGKGAFQRTMRGLQALLAAKRAGHYLGEITVNFVITDVMIGRIPEFVRWLDAFGVDTLYISYPWFISNETSMRMDAYRSRHLGTCEGASTERPSWHSYNYGLDPSRLSALREDVDRTNAIRWRVKVRYNPELSDEELGAFIDGSHVPAQRKTSCQSIYSRMDVFPDGKVVSCKFFPELVMGDLGQSSPHEVWNSEAFRHFRKTISQCGLMPVCAKCNLLYARGM